MYSERPAGRAGIEIPAGRAGIEIGQTDGNFPSQTACADVSQCKTTEAGGGYVYLYHLRIWMMNHCIAAAGKYCLTRKIPLSVTQNLNGKGKSSLPAPKQTHLQLGGATSPQQWELTPVRQWLLSPIKTVKTFLIRSFLLVFLFCWDTLCLSFLQALISFHMFCLTRE